MDAPRPRRSENISVAPFRLSSPHAQSSSAAKKEARGASCRARPNFVVLAPTLADRSQVASGAGGVLQRAVVFTLTRRASLHSPEHPLSSRGDFTAQHLRQASDLIARQPDAGLLRAARTEKPDTLRSGLASRPRDRFSERPHILRHRPVCDPYRYGVCRREELLYWNRRGAHGHDGSSASLPEY